MIKVTAEKLDEAYTKAAKELNCSVVDLDVEVLQHPSAGFLGFFAKQAIIKASLLSNDEKLLKEDVKPTLKIVKKAEETLIESKPQKKEREKKSFAYPKKVEEVVAPKKIEKQVEKKVEKKVTVDNKPAFKKISVPYEKPELVQSQIEDGIKKLLDASCFNIELIYVKVSNDLVDIKIDGADAALMIGKEGYRYKAISYILHNWIKIKYGRNISLEIAEFLKNQDETIENYLVSIKERVEDTGKAQTKPLDGIMIKLSLEKLRAAYPDKYVAIKTRKDGRKIIVVNSYRKESEQ